MDRAEELQTKISFFMQLSVIITYTILNLIHLLSRFFIPKDLNIATIIFTILNILLFISFYIFIKIRRMTGEHIFFTILALVLLANIFFNDNGYINIQTIYIIPILLTLVLADRLFTFLYSIIILIIFLTDQIINGQVCSFNSITILATFILTIVIIIFYNIWIIKSNKIRLDAMNDYNSNNMRILGRVAELKDEETHEHLERVSIVVEMLSNKLKRNPHYSSYISKFYIADLKAASALHDIGKIAIDDNILFKPGKLSEEEYDEMKKHTTIGAEFLEEALLKTSNKLYDLAIELTRHHHEKWDGTGYPDKLKGRNIPLSARIMSIADVYDALLSKRPYKKAYSERESYTIIVSESGSQFDPDLVRIFMKIHKKIYASIEHLL